MSRAERVVRGFRRTLKSGKPAVLTKGVKRFPPPGQQFMDVTLVPDVEKNAVLRGGKDPVQGDGQFDHAEVGRKMSAVAGNDAQNLVPHFRSERIQLSRVKALDVVGGMNGFE